MPYLETKNIKKTFGSQTALNNINVSIEKGELVCILGPSGCGKTTLLRIIAGLEPPDGGSVFIDHKDCTTLPPAKRNFGIVFQSYALFPNMTVAQNVLFGLRQKKEMTKAERVLKVCEVLDMVDLSLHKDKYPNQLSGGQQQRTALARAIALSPSYLLLDEPLSALDARVRAKLRGEIRDIQKELDITTIMVTHDQEEALTMADKIIVMNHARIEQIGTPEEIYEHPATPFVAGFIGAMNFFRRGGVTCAIRPEHVGLGTTMEWGYDNLPAVIRYLEYKGAQTRVHGVLPCSTEFCADISTEQAAGLKLEKDKNIVFQISRESLMKYPLDEAV